MKILRLSFLVLAATLLVYIGGLKIYRHYHPVEVVYEEGPSLGTTFIFTDPNLEPCPKPVVPTDRPPDKVKVGPYIYKIVYGNSCTMPGYLGHIDYNTLEIALLGSMEPSLMRESLVHELFHASVEIGVTKYRKGDSMDSDQFIEGASPTWLQVLQDNPELVKWLQKTETYRPVQPSNMQKGKTDTLSGLPQAGVLTYDLQLKYSK